MIIDVFNSMQLDFVAPLKPLVSRLEEVIVSIWILVIHDDHALERQTEGLCFLLRLHSELPQHFFAVVCQVKIFVVVGQH